MVRGGCCIALRKTIVAISRGRVSATRSNRLGSVYRARSPGFPPSPAGDAPALQSCDASQSCRATAPVAAIHSRHRQAMRPPYNPAMRRPPHPVGQPHRLPIHPQPGRRCARPTNQSCDASPNPVGQPLRLPVDPATGRRSARPTTLRCACPTASPWSNHPSSHAA
jgi:hypothetical protein